jgi:hypothetical protein
VKFDRFRHRGINQDVLDEIRKTIRSQDGIMHARYTGSGSLLLKLKQRRVRKMPVNFDHFMEMICEQIIDTMIQEIEKAQDKPRATMASSKQRGSQSFVNNKSRTIPATAATT